MTQFLINVYETGMSQFPTDIKDAESLTDAGQSQSVREILTRFAREGVVTTPDQMSARYADEFADDIDINDPRVDNLIDQPDLSDMDEMEIVDFVRDNSEQIDVNSLNKSELDPVSISSHKPAMDAPIDTDPQSSSTSVKSQQPDA